MQAKKSSGKTENLSLRLDPKTKFILDFVSRINGQTITTIVERAIRASCDQIELPGSVPEGDFAVSFNWKHFWDPHEGVRTLKLLANPAYPTSFDEDELKGFIEAHRQFFYVAGRSRTPNSSMVHVLWPKIDEYRRIWLEEREKDYWAAGIAMTADLTAANVEPPHWPPAPNPSPKPTARRVGQIEDEIPF
jgi:hypothetical protein